MSSSKKRVRLIVAALAAVAAIAGSTGTANAAQIVEKGSKQVGTCSIRSTLVGDNYAYFQAKGTLFCQTRQWTSVEVRLKLNGQAIPQAFATAKMWSGSSWLHTQWFYSYASCGRWQAVTNAYVRGYGWRYATSGTPRYFCRG